MRVSLILVVYTAVVTAAPPRIFDAILKRTSALTTVSLSTEECKRCGGFSRKKCAWKEICLGEKDIPDGLGVCVKLPEACDSLGKDCCSSGGFCVSSRNSGNLCIPKDAGEKVGLKHKKPRPPVKVTSRRTTAIAAIKSETFSKTTTTCTKKTKTSTRTYTTAESTSDKSQAPLPPFPTSDPGPGRRCNYSKDQHCEDDEICLGERELDDGVGGFCIKKPPYCGNGGEGDPVPCPNTEDTCVSDPTMDCPPDLADCGGGRCFPGSLIKQRKLVFKGKELWRCGGNSGKKCYDKIGETCVGENKSSDGTGICVKYPRDCEKEDCSEGWTCVTGQNSCQSRLGEEVCYKKVCLYNAYAEIAGIMGK